MRNIIMIFSSLILISCHKQTYQEYYFFNDGQWHSDSVVNYNYSILDTTKTYTLSLSIRHTVDYEYQNLFLFLDGEYKDTVEIILSNKKGKWLGSGISNIREFKYILDENKKYFKKGNYKLEVEQAMRYGSEEKIETLQHILDIGLIISKQNE